MDIRFSGLAYDLSKYKKIIFYGAGDFARKTWEGLWRKRIRVHACTVTKLKKNNGYFMDSIPVYQIDAYVSELQKEDTVILIAVSEQYEKEMETTLQRLKLKNYLCLSDYIKKEGIEWLYEDYKKKPTEKCIKEISEWYVDYKHEEWEKIDYIKKELENNIYHVEKNKNKIVAVIGDLKPRCIKILQSLKDSGKEIIILLSPGVLLNAICIEELLQSKIPFHECNCLEELMYRIIVEHPGIVHIFSCIINTVISYALIKMKDILSYMVYDEYDIINEFYYDYPPDWLDEERFCLEYADGICNRGYELEYLSQQGSYHFSGKIIQFFDYCSDKESRKSCQHKSETLSLCYAGGVITEKDYPDASFACWKELAQKCMEAQCHLHIYPLYWHEERYADYIMIEKRNPFFHFHHPVPNRLLCAELSQYDYGIHPVRADFLQKEVNGYNKKEKLIYGVTNKFFDYIDAGIPIIAASPTLFVKYFERIGGLIPWTIEEYNFEELRKNKTKYKKRAEAAFAELQIKHHIHKLISFYHSL